MPYGTVVLFCPQCGKPSTYELRNRSASQVVTCLHCRKAFRIEIRNGQVRGIR
jgi:hypothetical protein